MVSQQSHYFTSPPTQASSVATKIKVGQEISFTLYVYNPSPTGYIYDPLLVLNVTNGAEILGPTGEYPLLLAPGQEIPESFVIGPIPAKAGVVTIASIGALGPGGQMIDLTSLMAPAGIDPAAWSAVVANLSSQAGSTDTSLYNTFYTDSSALAEEGVFDSDASSLFAFELLKANDLPPVTAIPASNDFTDADSPLPLDFSLNYGNSITDHYADIGFGRGWQDNYDMNLSIDPNTDEVTVTTNGIPELFETRLNGTFAAETRGDTNVLGYSSATGIYALTSKGGTVILFYSAGSAAGKLKSIADPNGNTITLTYDNTGRLTSFSDSSGQKLTLTYDGNGNISQINNAQDQTCTYAYDPTGQYLLSITTPLGKTQYTYSFPTTGPTAYEITSIIGAEVGQTTSTGTLISAYAMANGELLDGVDSSGNASYYAFDGRGNTAEITSSTSVITTSYSYLPFGELNSSTGSSPNNLFTFEGELGVYQDGGGLIYMRLREYNIELGHFVQPDPAGLLADSNPYRYVSNNPLSFIDPSGLFGLYETSDQPIPTYFTIGFARGGAAAFTFNLNPNGDLYIQPNFGFGAGDLILGVRENGSLATDNQLSLNASGTLVLGGIPVSGSADLINLLTPGPSSRDWPIKEALTLGVGTKGYSFLLCVNIRLGNLNNLIKINALLKLIYIQVGPTDPNFISGPTGFGPQNDIAGNSTLTYTVGFENEPNASAPAQIVTVTDQLPSTVNWSTFQFGDFYFDGNNYSVPAGRQQYSTRIDLTSTLGIYVDVAATFNALTGRASWVFTSIDPATLDVPATRRSDFFPPTSIRPMAKARFPIACRPMPAWRAAQPCRPTHLSSSTRMRPSTPARTPIPSTAPPPSVPHPRCRPFRRRRSP